MKDNACVGVELRQIYLSGRRSHHPNDAPCQKLTNPSYHAKNGENAAVTGTEQEEKPISWSRRRRLADTIHERYRHRSERSASTQSHQPRDAAMKENAGMGVELRQIYLPVRRSHHPNDAPCQNLPNPNYHAKKGGPPPSCRRSGKQKERGPALLPVEFGGTRRHLLIALRRLC